MDDIIGRRPTLPPTRSFSPPRSRHIAVNPSFQLESPLHESTFNVADLLAGLPAHGPLDPSLSSHYHPVGPLEGLSLNDTLGSMDPFPDSMDWLTLACEVDGAYSEAPTHYEYEGPPTFTRDAPSLFALASSRSEGGPSGTTHASERHHSDEHE